MNCRCGMPGCPDCDMEMGYDDFADMDDLPVEYSPEPREPDEAEIKEKAKKALTEKAMKRAAVSMTFQDKVRMNNQKFGQK